MRSSIFNRLNISDKRLKLESELLLAKNLIKNEKYDLALKKLMFLQTISQKNQRILSLLSTVKTHLKDDA